MEIQLLFSGPDGLGIVIFFVNYFTYYNQVFLNLVPTTFIKDQTSFGCKCNNMLSVK